MRDRALLANAVILPIYTSRLRYERNGNFIRENRNKKILFLELGVGFNASGIIKYPFMRMTNTFKDAFYICINKGEAYLPDELKDKSLAIDGDIAKIVAEFSDSAIE